VQAIDANANAKTSAKEKRRTSGRMVEHVLALR
jgi:hypothetical protein